MPVGVVSLRDETGSTGYVRVGITAGTSAAAALSALVELGGLLASASGAVWYQVSVTYRTVVSDGRAPAGSDVGPELVLVLSTAEEGEYAVVVVPGAPDDMFGPDGGALPGDPRVSALVAVLVSAPFCNPFGIDITGLETAFKGDNGQ